MNSRFWLLCFVLCLACKVGTDDEPIGVTDDMPDDEVPAEGVNFTVSVLSRVDEGDYFLVDVSRGETIGANVNLNLEMNMDRGVVYRVEDNHLIFYRPSFFNRTWIRNISTGAFNFYEGYFQPEVDPFNVSTLGSTRHILTLYNDNLDPERLLIDQFTPETSEEGTLYSTRSNLDVVLAGNDQFILTYQDDESRTQLEAFDLTSREQVLQSDITSLRALTLAEDKIYLFGANVFRTFDFSTGQLGSPVGTVENINRGGLFRSSLFNNRLYYPFVYSQPSILLEGPAYFDLDNGTNTILDIFPLVDLLEDRGQFFLTPGPFVVEPNSEVIIVAYAYFTEDDPNEQWALAYLDFDIRILSLVDLPAKPLSLIFP